MNETSSLDSGRIPQKPERSEHLDIPIEKVLATQQFLMHKMMPERLVPYLSKSDGEHVGIEDDLFMRWHEKYSEYFRNYCDGLDPVTSAGLIERIQKGTLDDDNHLAIQKYLEATGHGGVFFIEAELDEFIKQYVH